MYLIYLEHITRNIIFFFSIWLHEHEHIHQREHEHEHEHEHEYKHKREHEHEHENEHEHMKINKINLLFVFLKIWKAETKQWQLEILTYLFLGN